MMTLFSEQVLIFNGCIRDLMSNLIKKYWTVSNNRPFECEKCESKYKSKPALEYHVSTFHEGKKPKHRNKQIKEKIFSCDQCGYKGAKYLVFVSSRSLKMREFSFLSLYTF